MALATSSAQASADFNKALAVALSKQATAQGAADRAFTVAADGLEWSLISGSASAEWGYSIGLIARENVFAASRAAADKTVDVAYAEAGRQSGIDYAIAEKAYQVTLATAASTAATQRAAAEGTLATAKIDAIQTGDDSSLTAAITVHDTANETAWEAQSLAESAAKSARELAWAEADLTRTISEADADVVWAGSLAADITTFNTDHAAAGVALATQLAGIEKSYTTGLASAEAAFSNAYAAAETDLWDAEVAADNVWNTATASAISTFRAADFAAQSLATSNLPVAFSPSAAWSDWSQFQASLAATKENWWNSQQANYLTWDADTNSASTTYQSSVSNRYKTLATTRSTADVDYVSGLADEVEAYQIGAASADAAHLLSTGSAESAYFVAVVAAERNQRVAGAQAYRDQVAMGDEFDSSAAWQAISDAHTAATDDGRQSYTLAATQANGVRNVARAAVATSFTKSTSTLAESWQNATAAAFASFANDEADAFTTKVTDIANLNVLFQTTQSQTLANDIALLSATNASPWAHLEADKITATTAHTSTLAIEESIHTIALANAKKDFDQTQATAGATLVNAVSPPSNNGSQAQTIALAIQKNNAGQRLREGESVVPNLKPGGPNDVPDKLEGVWKVSVVAGGGHCWIRYENIETGDVHTVGRYAMRYGGRQDEEGNWVVPPVAVAGIQWDKDKMKEEGFKAGMFKSRSIIVEDPEIFKENRFGYNTFTNNCTTYARDAWYHHSGEWTYLPVPRTEALEAWIDAKNAKRMESNWPEPYDRIPTALPIQ